MKKKVLGIGFDWDEVLGEGTRAALQWFALEHTAVF